jgi:hypothetical protein
MSNRTRATTTNNPFLLPKNRRAASGNDGWDFRCAEKKGENPPLGTIAREGMRYRSHTKQRLDFLEKQEV